MSVTYTADLSVREETVLLLSGLLDTERKRRGTRPGTRALGCFKQAILVIRWFLDGTRVKQLAADNQVSPSTGYAYLHEGIRALAAHAPGLEGRLDAPRSVYRRLPRASRKVERQLLHWLGWKAAIDSRRNPTTNVSNSGRV